MDAKNGTEAHENADVLSSIVINETGSERRVLIPLSRALLEAGFQRDDQGVRSQRREARMARPRGVRRYRWRRLLGFSGMVWPRAPEATSLAMVSWR
jgi:hypothetical protein